MRPVERTDRLGGGLHSTSQPFFAKYASASGDNCTLPIWPEPRTSWSHPFSKMTRDNPSASGFRGQVGPRGAAATYCSANCRGKEGLEGATDRTAVAGDWDLVDGAI